MAKKPSIATLVSGYTSASRLNTIFQQILDAFDNTVSRDGSTPNTMSADLDMNNNDLLNVKEVRATKLYAGGTQVTDATYVPNWEGEWTTATAYVVNDTVRNDGNVYICLVAHTSGTFSTDLGAGKWELFASKGSAGAGSGDMLAANNLSDLADAAASRTNLGVSIGNDVQAYSAKTSALAALTWAANKILLFTGAGTVSTLDFKDEDNQSSNSDTAVPSQQSVVAYVSSDNTDVIQVQDEKTIGTSAGSITAGSWVTRDLNQTKTNTISGASLSSNQITLPAGTYEIEATAPAFAVAQHVTRLYDTTGAAVLLTGTAEYSSSDQTRSKIKGRFTLSTTSALEIQHRCASTAGGNGLGVDNTITTNVYTEATIRKVA